MNDDTQNMSDVEIVLELEGLAPEAPELVRQEVERGEQEFANLAEAIHGQELAFLMQHPREWTALGQVMGDEWKSAVRDRIAEQTAEYKKRALDAAILVIKHDGGRDADHQS
jgi:hypothetical protein